MAETATLPPTAGPTTAQSTHSSRIATSITIPPMSLSLPINNVASRLRDTLGLPAPSPVNQNGSFEFDRVIKSGYVQKRTQTTKTWKSIYLVLRPNTLSVYKSDKENKLRHKIYLSDLSAVVPLKDPKQKRQNLFGLFSPAKNYHFEAPTTKDAQEWIDLIRQDARIEEEEEEMFLASPIVRRQSFAPAAVLRSTDGTHDAPATVIADQAILSSSPEPLDRIRSKSSYGGPGSRRLSHNDYSGMSGNELVSDASDNEAALRSAGHGASIELPRTSASNSNNANSTATAALQRPTVSGRHISQISTVNVEHDPDRVIWQGWLWYLKGKRGMRSWKNVWSVLRPRNLILYKDESEYTAQFILPLTSVVNVMDIDPISRTKVHCLQVITDEKSYRFCAPDEESLVQCLGAFKSLLAKRKELEARAGSGPAQPQGAGLGNANGNASTAAPITTAP
ncbi:PH-domain-containing protein [Xylariaceae sp. FL0255]|nr:PH-domain-containing protein [Xylariaceae sp. FL0255]